MAKDLYAGNFDLALTGADNMIAYNEGQGETDLGGRSGLVVLFGVDPIMLQIIAVPQIKTIAVDAMTSGFAFVLNEALAKQGNAVSDVKWDKVGGGAQRLQALLEGKQDATLLKAALDIAAEAKGFVRLQDTSQALGAYQGISGSTRQGAAAAKHSEIKAFIRAFKESMDWLTTPSNREEAMGLLTKKLRGM
jgi:ABC-type nitrate/sulfonate/bicarbonate transport system substrate-binding protein